MERGSGERWPRGGTLGRERGGRQDVRLSRRELGHVAY